MGPESCQTSSISRFKLSKNGIITCAWKTGLQFQKYSLARLHLAMPSSDYSRMQDDGKYKDTWLG